MLRQGSNLIDGVTVEVTRKNTRRINLRIGRDGVVHLSIPAWRSTLREGEAFLLSKWKWIEKVRREATENPRPSLPPVTDAQIVELRKLLAELHDFWTFMLGEHGVSWSLRRMKSLWGTCHFVKRKIVYSTALANATREQVEYVVVHELTHLKAHNHGPQFYALMDERLPAWRQLRREMR